MMKIHSLVTGNAIPNACLYLLQRLICSTTATTTTKKNWACIGFDSSCDPLPSSSQIYGWMIIHPWMVNLPFLMNVSYLLRDGFEVVAVEPKRGKKKDLHWFLLLLWHPLASCSQEETQRSCKRFKMVCNLHSFLSIHKTQFISKERWVQKGSGTGLLWVVWWECVCVCVSFGQVFSRVMLLCTQQLISSKGILLSNSRNWKL